MTGRADRLARVALNWLLEPGHLIGWEMVHAYGAPEALWRILNDPACHSATRNTAAARLRAGDPLQTAEGFLTRAEQVGARLLVPGDEEWPEQVADLRTIDLRSDRERVDRDTRPPLCLWARGPLPLAASLARSVAVVGARAATEYGDRIASEIGFDLASQGWTVVSGGAFGVDGAAHRSALRAGGVTIAVLACGIDRPYPSGNTALFERISETGLLLSEWAPGEPPLRHRFLVRNRLIAAATRGTVVVEAAARSGAIQTLGRAHALPGRTAMAVPGPVGSLMSVGCHDALRNQPGTRLVTSAADILEEVGSIGDDLAPRPRGTVQDRDRLDEDSARLLDAFPHGREITADQLSARAGIDPRTTLRRLALLVELGFVVDHGGSYVLVPPRRVPPS
ncbi:DNA-processing protein DprA [Catenuloplanes atrovinosus]|uniref:DNA processing protein n=1 Tax=Catenuloplanes atrovinosus TaxID=137266 RepID=A0AAE3YK46_9ACTN|nr:DNA-processing protein DprA [Catenuloplanes atrovinosus]MDR7273336.1 DNA processing protein [Catenuloplanes atrovinosus]